MALEKAGRGAADSRAVPIVRKAQRRSLAPTGLTHATHRIAANTGWAHRSSAKAPLSLTTAASRGRRQAIFTATAHMVIDHRDEISPP